MGYATLEGVTGSVEMVLFPRTLQQYMACFYEDSPVFVRGRLNVREERANSLLIEELKPLSQLSCTVYLKFPVLTQDAMKAAAAVLGAYPGKTPVILFDASKRLSKSVPESLYVEVSDPFKAAATAAFGKENVVIK